MPTIYDNIKTPLSEGLSAALQGAARADFCVGYFNLRGWRVVANEVNKLTGEEGEFCRLLVGMTVPPQKEVQQLYSPGEPPMMSNKIANKIKKKALEDFRRQLMQGAPSNIDQQGLQKLARQLKEGRLRVKLYTRHPLHAKLYLAHRGGADVAAAFVGSSNLTFSGLQGNGELNVDVVEIAAAGAPAQASAKELSDWFQARWEEPFNIEITSELRRHIQSSWVREDIPPYHIYVKTAWHLSHRAVDEASRYQLPEDLEADMLKHQHRALALAAQRLEQKRGVIIGDVVGLGKTLSATALAKVFQEDHYHNVLIICPPALQEMWKAHAHRYRLAADVLSLGIVRELSKMPRYHLVIIDESHNLRNRDSIRHRQVREYVKKNESKVVLLTATPYNKANADIIGQLLLFNEPDEDLGIKPENYIKRLGGAEGFQQEHPNISPFSLAAFECSESIDDWRELMRLFMVRRTRRHLKEAGYTEKDENNGRHYLAMSNGEKYYLPRRVPKRLGFKVEEGDQYAKLYSVHMVETIGRLLFPRYGLKKYLTKDAPKGDPVIANLSRAGRRLVGFARIGLFKRLESSGEAFLLSLRRHVIRNTAMIAAYHKGAIFVGNVLPAHMDEAGEEDNALFATTEGETIEDITTAAPAASTWAEYQQQGEAALARILQEEHKFQWVSSDHLQEELVEALEADAKALIELLNIVPVWQAEQDRKLDALRALCEDTHAGEKVLIFTQYKDTAEYIHRHLSPERKDIACVHGESEHEDILKTVRKFSPNFNDSTEREETRILIATDKLSEGVNLQDAHIILNYDLPWGIIRLAQRAGRVDRIGQKAETVLCYSALPEDGVEQIINLRRRLKQRMQENQKLIGSDEVFFDDSEIEDVDRVYNESINLEQEVDDETDLISRADDIYQRAIRQNLALEDVIKNLPNVVYSAKRAVGGNAGSSVIAYVKDSRDNDMLIELDSSGEVVSQSQYALLDKMACAPEEERQTAAGNHHELVKKAMEYSGSLEHSVGGQLGGTRNVRHRVYQRLLALAERGGAPLITDEGELRAACQLVYDWPLKEAARNRLKRQFQNKIEDRDFVAMVLALYHRGELCALPQHHTEENPQAQIICSMGLVAAVKAEKEE